MQFLFFNNVALFFNQTSFLFFFIDDILKLNIKNTALNGSDFSTKEKLPERLFNVFDYIHSILYPLLKNP